jgi:spore cortex formation protein SpoVR/YcgB (stage V sporulation)
MSKEVNVIKYLEQLKEHSSDETLKDFVGLSLLYSMADIFGDLGFVATYLKAKERLRWK